MAITLLNSQGEQDNNLSQNGQVFSTLEVDKIENLKETNLYSFCKLQGSPLLESMKIDQVIDPRLENDYVKKEVECMMIAANLCISPYPEKRPRMSKVFSFFPSFLN